jgi:opine dehydrogenase
MDAVDHERLELARAGVRAVPFAELFHQLGFTTGQGLHGGGAYHAIRRSELIRPLQSPPPRLDHRYLHEDVGWGLVPWMHLATAATSPAPTITALTRLVGMINGIDYPREGLTPNAWD